MITVSEYGTLMCDGCGKWYDSVHLVVMGDWLDRVWSYVFCVPCVMKIHTLYMTVRNRSIMTTMNVTVRGQNISVSEILVWEEKIDCGNFLLYDLPDTAIQR
jgi:hypothetical protein